LPLASTPSSSRLLLVLSYSCTLPLLYCRPYLSTTSINNFYEPTGVYNFMTRANMMHSSYRELDYSFLQLFCATLLVLYFIPITQAYSQNPFFAKNPNSKPRPARSGPPTKRDGSLPLVISNLCDSTIWPGIGTQAGTGAGTGGFELASGDSRSFMVSADWQGRVWGRTNCSFNVAGNGPANIMNGGAACYTGDCGGVLDCVATVSKRLHSSLEWLLTSHLGGNSCHFG
jgi:hypothetical protein